MREALSTSLGIFLGQAAIGDDQRAVPRLAAVDRVLGDVEAGEPQIRTFAANVSNLARIRDVAASHTRESGD